MKPTAYLLPTSVLLLGGIWMVAQISEISDLENEIAQMKRRIKSSPQMSSASSERQTRKTPLEHARVDWSLVADEFSRGHGRHGIFKSSLKLEEQLRQLSGPELIKALDEIEKSDLPDEEVKSLTIRLLGLLLEKSPGHIVTHPSNDPRLAAIYQNMQNPALAFWAKFSPNDAVTWLDSQDFPPRKQMNLEHSLISSLMISDFALAKARFTEIAPEKRKRLLGSYTSFGTAWKIEEVNSHDIAKRFAGFNRLLPDDQKMYLASPLTWLGDQDRPAGISRIQESLKGWKEKPHGGLSRQVIDDYLSKIEPTRDEFHRCVEALVSEKRIHPPNQPEIEGDALRAWLVSEFSSHIHGQ